MTKRSMVVGYAGLRVTRPFLPILLLIVFVGFACCAALLRLSYYIDLSDSGTFPLLTAFVSIAAIGVATIGWGVASWIAHRNARVQHTITIIATRFSQAAFVNQLILFNNNFGDDRQPLVTTRMMADLSKTRDEHDQQVYQSAKYILNYFEFIAVGIISGELDLNIVKKNLKGSMIHYYEKCGPYIGDLRKNSPDVLEHYSKLVDSFRDPMVLEYV